MIRKNTIAAVFDCTVFAQALINPNGPSGACLAAAQLNQIDLFVSDYVIQEIRELPGKLPPRFGVTEERVNALIDDLAKYTELIRSVPKVFSYARDEDDAPYIDLAVAARADCIVSRDNDLLDLMKQETTDGLDFADRFPNLHILNPPALLQRLPKTPLS
jgi:putative PIN family toxin of toxin-antitoxin system